MNDTRKVTKRAYGHICTCERRGLRVEIYGWAETRTDANGIGSCVIEFPWGIGGPGETRFAMHAPQSLVPHGVVDASNLPRYMPMSPR